MPADVTQLLADVRAGRPLAADELFGVMLEELRGQAAAMLRRERRGHTLQTTALVNEAYLRLVGPAASGGGEDGGAAGEGSAGHAWQDRAHFLAVAARAMRHILVDHARQRNRVKRGGGRDRVELNSALLLEYETAAGVDVEALSTALAALAEIRPRAASVVDMRFFAGMSVEEVACVLGASISTVEREWRYARAWLKSELDSELDERAGNTRDGSEAGATGG